MTARARLPPAPTFAYGASVGPRRISLFSRVNIPGLNECPAALDRGFNAKSSAIFS